MKPRQPLFFKIFAALGLAAAAFHAAHFWRAIDGSSGTRHGLFIAIDLVFAWAMLARPRFLMPFLIVLTVQQFGSHGSRLVRWAAEGRVDWLSLGVLVALPICLFRVWRELNAIRNV